MLWQHNLVTVLPYWRFWICSGCIFKFKLKSWSLQSSGWKLKLSLQVSLVASLDITGLLHTNSCVKNCKCLQTVSEKLSCFKEENSLFLPHLRRLQRSHSPNKVPFTGSYPLRELTYLYFSNLKHKTCCYWFLSQQRNWFHFFFLLKLTTRSVGVPGVIETRKKKEVTLHHLNLCWPYGNNLVKEK